VQEIKRLPLEEFDGWVVLNELELEERAKREKQNPRAPATGRHGPPARLRNGRRRRMPDGTPVVESSDDG
jgi:hypothetical protein